MIKRVSILICTRNRYNDLKSCIESIISSYPSYQYNELIIVDSSDNKSIRSANQELANKYGFIYLYEPRKGLSIARNTGIKNSSGNIIVFADDDFIVDKNWIKNLIKNYDDENVMCCTGRMLASNANEASKLYEKAMSFDRGDKRYEITKKNMSIINIIKTVSKIGEKRLKDKTPPPYNAGYGFGSFRRNIFDEIGFFDEMLGRGAQYIGSDDVDIYYRILKAEYKIVYEPSAFIHHVHRQTKEGVFNDAYNSGASIKALTTKYIKRLDTYMLFIFFGELFLLFFSLIKSSLGSDDEFKQMILKEFEGFLKGYSYKPNGK